MPEATDRARDTVASLVERFRSHLESYRSSGYRETEVRVEYIDPFFEALGWDVHNKLGYAEPYKDVVHEESMRSAAGIEAPDYTFRIGGMRKFFVEAKKPAVNVKADAGPAYQLRRYAWSGKLPLSILTDFEELAVYDCTRRPAPTDAAGIGRTHYLTCDQYPERWPDIWSLFAKDSVLRGSLDSYVRGSKRGTNPVDREILKEIEAWREELARNLALRNPQLSVDELNLAVQLTIDRILFLRVAEDRGSEEYGRLQALLNGANVYPRLAELYRLADQKYNAGLFNLKADRLTPTLTLDDRVLKEIINGLYYPQSPYEFTMIAGDILGQVYEQFLGKVIRLTAGHRAVVEEKPEVKKAGGVYYTPTYIVDYIVEHTVGELIKGQTPEQISKLRVLDPACGSGSFLLGAYQHLLDYHLDWYTRHDPEQWAAAKKPPLRRVSQGEWRLTTAEKKRILLNNIYGVDIDRQAVEVTKLNLLLKVLEGENDETLGQQLRLWQERALPDLGKNIKCGNSLIGPDYWQGKQMALFDPEEVRRVNAFDWQAEFPAVFEAGGFDAVIGNPPWGATFAPDEEAYFRTRYDAGRVRVQDSYALFMECGLRVLALKGRLGFITPDTFLRKDDREAVRALILGGTTLIDLVEAGPLFSQVRDTWCAVLTLAKEPPKPATAVQHKKISRFVVSAEERLTKFSRLEWDMESRVDQQFWASRPSLVVGYLASPEQQRVVAKLEAHPRLGDLSARFRISRGEEGSKFKVTQEQSGDYFMVIPADVERHAVGEGVRISSATLTPSKVDDLYSHPKVWVVRIQKMRWVRRIICGLDERRNSAGMKTLQVIVSRTDDLDELKCLLGVLASSSIQYWCVNYLADDMNESYLRKLPVALPADAARHARMVELVTRMLELHQRLAAARTEADRELYSRQIAATDKEIDALVYELYGLTQEEIKIVEGTTGTGG